MAITKEQKLSFIQKILSGAYATYRKYKVLPSLTLAQGCLESGYGTSELAVNANDLFGMKWFPGCGFEPYSVDTQEYIDGEWITVKAPFMQFHTVTQCIEKHGVLMTKPRYKKVIETTDWKTATEEVWKAGYATDPTYPSKLQNVITAFKLDEYDRRAFTMAQIKDYDKIPDWQKPSVVKIVQLGLMVGDGKGLFNADEPFTRGEFAVVLDKIYESFLK